MKVADVVAYLLEENQEAECVMFDEATDRVTDISVIAAGDETDPEDSMRVYITAMHNAPNKGVTY